MSYDDDSWLSDMTPSDELYRKEIIAASIAGILIIAGILALSWWVVS